AEVDALARRFVAWFERLVLQPRTAGEDAWVPDRLEYRFACSAPEEAGEKVLAAEEYHHGHLDWYNLDVDRAAAPLGGAAPAAAPPAADTRTLLPVPVAFDGMPNTRWWTFEDRRTNLGDVTPDTTDLGKLLLIEFALVYANDWLLVPYTVPAGSLVRVRGLAVTDVFGERRWIEAAGAGADDDWQRWAMFQLATRGVGGAADTALVLLPTVPKIQEGPPLEEVVLIRDEVANMVWGIEKTVPLPTGWGKPGGEAAQETLAFFQADLARRRGPAAPAAPESAATIRYQVMTSVPEHWIPFVPVHVPGDNREIQLQRAAMPRLLEGDPEPARRVRPRTALLRAGLDQTEPAPYFVHEEEVPGAGARV
ncbi:MAG TPA: hypothetical protein VFX28_16095, partial [Methylomirabilota bacterium]|nr:hypothetical protein [Methylomirabilota bacterium]